MPAKWNAPPTGRRSVGKPALPKRPDHAEASPAPESAEHLLTAVKAGRTTFGSRDVLALQRLSGNRAVSALIGSQRGPSTRPPAIAPAAPAGRAVPGSWAPPPTMVRSVQRHSLAGLPPAPAPEEQEPVVQGIWNPSVQRQPKLAAHRVPPPLPKKVMPKVPLPPLPPIPGFGALTLDHTDIPADGAATAQGQVVGVGKQGLVWSIDAAWTGSTVDANGVVHAGTKMGVAAQKAMVVHVQEKGGLGRKASAPINIVEPVLFKARADCKTFLAGGPYVWNNYVTDNGFGRFDATYSPAAKLLRIDMRLKFDFADDPIPAVGTPKEKKEVEDRQDAYVTTILQQAKAGWDRRFSFENIRAPKAVWGGLGPIAVETNFSRTKGADQHFLFYARTKTAGTANVSPTAETEFFKDTDKAKQAFNPESQIGETLRVKEAAPDLFTAKGALTGPSKASAAFLGLYLKRLNVPPFKLKLHGHGGRKAGLADSALAKDAIVTGGLGPPHTIVTGWRFGGKAGHVTIKPTVSGSWRNVQEVTAHEFGHMLGLDDEYATSATPKGKGIETYDRVKAMFGKQYADLTAKAGIDSASLMDGGNDVRIQHSVTLWDVLNDITTKKAAVPNPKFGEADWKVIG